VTGSSLLYSLRGRIRSTLSDNRPSTSGKRWFIILQGQVSCAEKSNCVDLNIILVREIISDLIDQLIKLVSSDEFEQQEVRCQKIEIDFGLTLRRLPQGLLRSCARSPEKSYWQTLS
jgi:hypothetical protein